MTCEDKDDGVMTSGAGEVSGGNEVAGLVCEGSCAGRHRRDGGCGIVWCRGGRVCAR